MDSDPVDAELSRLQLDEMLRVISDCVHKVANVLGPGFLASVYENALSHELRKTGFSVEQHCPVQVVYDGVVVGECVADMVVNGAILIKLEAVERLEEPHLVQSLNCLRASGLRVGLLVNFGSSKVDIERIVNNA